VNRRLINTVNNCITRACTVAVGAVLVLFSNIDMYTQTQTVIMVSTNLTFYLPWFIGHCSNSVTQQPQNILAN